jgi:hypothetical protein
LEQSDYDVGDEHERFGNGDIGGGINLGARIDA